MKRTFVTVLSALLLVGSSSYASAQLSLAKDNPVVYGHHHLNVTSLDEHKKFWVDVMGGVATTTGANKTDVIKFPNALIFFRVQKPTGPTKGTSVNHIGFSVPNMRTAVDQIKAKGGRMVTRAELAPTVEVKDDIANLNGRVTIAFVMGPDDVKIELVEVKDQTVPIMSHHVHFAGPSNTEMQAWYVKTFGAKASASGTGNPSATLPGISLNFTQSPDPVVGTTGRSLDHIGFEVKNLEEFCKKLEAAGIKLNVPYRKVPALNIGLAFITDPWGTYIELTEGLDQIS